MKALLVVVVLVLGGVVGLAAIAGGGAPASSTSQVPDGATVGDIPTSLLGVYTAAAGSCPGLLWSVLAAIGSIESRHGQGRLDESSGEVVPHILGPALDGRNGFARIRDETSPDGWAHAQGPMQFLPDTWRTWGRVAPGRPAGALASPHNTWDAIWSAAAYLCGSAGRVTDVRSAIRTYNHSDTYVNRVLAKAKEYEAALPRQPVSGDGMVCPVAAPVRHSNDWHARRSGGRQHQGNDVFAPRGSVLVAVENGVIDKTTDVETGLGGITIWIRGDSGTRWYYAHNTQNLVARGTRVAAGQPVAMIGNTGNARGTSTHVHFEMHPGGGAAANPFPLIARLCD
jgi:hypothetical protein